MNNLTRKDFLKTSSLAAFAGPAALGALLTGCAPGTSPTPSPTPSPVSNAIETALPIIRIAAAVATGAALDFGVQQASTRTRLANEMYQAASAIYSLTAGAFPTPAQLASTIAAFGGSSADQSYSTFSTAIASLYASWYPKLVAGDTKTAGDLLNAIAGGVEDATGAYTQTPAPTVSITA